MKSKVVCRVLSANGELLGWVEHHAALRGDGVLRASGVVTAAIACEGVAQTLSVHWCDPNVEIRLPFERVVRPGPLNLFSEDEPIIMIGKPAGGLPPITVGSVAIALQPAAIGAKG